MSDLARSATLDGPFDFAAERGMLGALLFAPSDSGLVWTVRAIAKPTDCGDPRNRLVFEALLALAERGDPFDIRTIANELTTRSRLDAAGGRQYIAELTEASPRVDAVESYASIVADMATRRRTGAKAVQVAKAAAAAAPIATLQGLARETLELSTATTRDDLAPMSDAVKEEQERMLCDTQEGVVSTGLSALDSALAGGLWDGQTVVVGARPSVGKSAIGLGFALAAAIKCRADAHGVVVFISVEMPKRALAARAACALIAFADPDRPVDLMLVRKRELDAIDTRRYADALKDVDSLPMLISDRRDVTPTRARALCLQARARHGRVALVVLDYLQKMQPDTRHESREREVAETSRTFSALAGELGCPVVLLSQLNRKAADQPPKMADLRESGAIEQDADVILLAHRDENGRSVAVEKQRDGATTDGPIKLRWVPAAACFIDAPAGYGA